MPGYSKAAICETTTGNVYSINSVGKEILLGVREGAEYKSKLADAGLLKREPIQVERIKGEFKLDFVWFEILSDDCNERCAHCYDDSMPPTYRKLIGFEDIPVLESGPSNQKMTSNDWKENISKTYQLGARNCQFIGGEPFLYCDEEGNGVLELARYARQTGFEMIEIFTNATLIRDRDISIIKELGLNIAVSLYSSEEEIHDKITRTPGSFKKTMNTLKKLSDVGIPTRVETVLMKQNEDTIDSTNQLISNMGFAHRPPDVLRPKGRGDDPTIQPSDRLLVRNGLMLGPNFNADPAFFKLSSLGHNCLAGKITITDNGEALPCIFSRGKVMGSLKNQQLEEIINENLNSVWQTSKDDVLVCQDCEYRYVCFDCRPISEGAAAGNGDYRSAPYPRCTYNPYSGEWGNGTWKLDEEGVPYYDESLKSIIEEARVLQLPQVKQAGH